MNFHTGKHGLYFLAASVLLLIPVFFRQNSTASHPKGSTTRVKGESFVQSNPAKKYISSSEASSVPASFQGLQKKYQLVFIPTYDGSNQLTHPKILYFQNGWNGYKYWMVMTPYPHSSAIYENPSIVVSNNGINWYTPKGLQNPVSGIPKDVDNGGHYSDPHLVMHGDRKMELWYRYNPSLKDGRKRPDNSTNIYYRKTTEDGIHWTDAQKMMQCSDGHLSLCVNYANGAYEIWYATYDGFLYNSQSNNAEKWSPPIRCTVALPKGLQPYHQDIIQDGSSYYLLQTAEKKANYTFQLFLFKSKDGIHFTDMHQIYPNSDTSLWKNISFYRSTLFVKDNQLNLYISLIFPKWNWYITKSMIPLP